MLRTVLVYGEPGAQLPVLESRDPSLAREVFARVRQEYQEAAGRCGDPVLRMLINSEIEQAGRVLQAAGLEVRDGQ